MRPLVDRRFLDAEQIGDLIWGQEAVHVIFSSAESNDQGLGLHPILGCGHHRKPNGANLLCVIGWE